jgi:hypothetical protein
MYVLAYVTACLYLRHISMYLCLPVRLYSHALPSKAEIMCKYKVNENLNVAYILECYALSNGGLGFPVS